MSTVERKSLLASKLQDIFNLPTSEEILGEYSCWLFRSVLLKGYLYLTTGHLCFYAHLKQKDEDESDGTIIKQGLLSRRNLSKFKQRYSKYWFTLKDSILSWYSSSNELYFPCGQLDLHYCTKLESKSSNPKYPNQFRLTVSDKAYTFATESLQNKQEWIKVLKKVIFTCQHSGENVKISIPLETIEDVEACQSLQFVETIRIKTKEWAEHQEASNPSSHPASEISSRPSALDLVESSCSEAVTIPDDYFFAFVQDIQVPLQHIQSILLDFSQSGPPLGRSSTSPLTYSPPQATIRDSVQFATLPSNLASSPLDSPGLRAVHDSTRSINRSPVGYPPRRSSSVDPSPMALPAPLIRQLSGSRQCPSSADSKPNPSKSLVQRIRKISSTSNRLVGGPIRSTSIKVRHPHVHANTRLPPCDPLVEQFNETSERNLSGNPGMVDDLAVPSESPTDANSPKSPARAETPKRQGSGSESPMSQSHTYPPDRRRYSSYTPKSSPRRKAEPNQNPGPLSANSQHPPSNWGMLPGWLKNVPTINPMKPAKDLINSKALTTAKNILIAPLVSSSAAGGSKSMEDDTNPAPERDERNKGKHRSRVSITVSNPNPSVSSDAGQMSADLHRSMVLVEQPEQPEIEPASLSSITRRDEKKFQSTFNFSNPCYSQSDRMKEVKLLLKASCYLFRGVPIYGQLYLSKPNQLNSSNYRRCCLCFKGHKPISKTITKMILPLIEILHIRLKKGFRFGYFGLVIIVKSGTDEEIFVEFLNEFQRTFVLDQMNKLIEEIKAVEAMALVDKSERDIENEHLDAKRLREGLRGLMDQESPEVEDEDEEDEEDEDNLRVMSETDMEGQRAEVEDPEAELLHKRRRGAATDVTGGGGDGASTAPIMFQSTSSSFLNFKPQEKLHITCLTIGSRGDVQPYIALCNELAKDGHRTRIASHSEYKDWIEGYGIEFVGIGGDPAELMKICVDNGLFLFLLFDLSLTKWWSLITSRWPSGMFTLSFIKEGLSKVSTSFDMPDFKTGRKTLRLTLGLFLVPAASWS